MIPPPDLSVLFPESEPALSQLQALVQPLLAEVWAGRRPPVAPDQIEALLASMPVEVPETGRDAEQIIDDIRRFVLPGSFPATWKGSIAHMDTLPAALPALIEALTASLNNNMLFAELSPALTHLEQRLTEWMAGWFGLPPGSGGLLASGGSLANLLALLAARHRFDPVAGETGCAPQQRPVVLASEDAHVSVAKALRVLGLGLQALRTWPTDASGRSDPHVVQELVDRCRSEGRPVMAIVATAGTTITGAIDPLETLGRCARECGAWFHVDAAYGGAVQFSPTHRTRLRGIDLADSITFNPQKWLWVPKACAMLLLREPQALRHAVDAPMPYARPASVNLADYSIQGTRPGDALKLWVALQWIGLRRLGALIDYTMDLGAHFAAAVERSSRYRLCSRGDLNIVVFRPADADADVVRHRQWLEVERGCIVSCPEYKGRRWLRAVLLNPRITRGDIEAWLA